MTPNLNSARRAIQAELSHARQGAAFYSARVEALETALTQLESVDTDDTTLLDEEERKPAKKKAGRRGRAARQEVPGRRKAASQETKQSKRGRISGAATEDSGLPTTGADFWLELVTNEPQSAVDIANAAAAHLGLGPDQKAQVQKLKQRVAPALATLVSTQKIQHAGAGRQRRYFRGDASHTA
ncbi:hypothetical protein [Noviherbaspirillum denitrificans]|uniref:Uncharacterized protein n=1 Tax=Noviherbaspirillum denitrificans TaxID=1968433 RepID=A0A254TCX6_9BURK|nr:hypothetical protein [Noviherbaspirillum denitrificans]OWW20491.1 hypothetical protein AYR66_14345 [Noviherbaspirillum denitrificans]